MSEIKLWSTEKFDFISNSVVVYGVDPTLGKPQTKSVSAEISDNPHKLSRITGWMEDGTKVSVGLRGRADVGEKPAALGKEGFVVAFDGLQWQTEKDANGKYTREVKKTEDGTLLATANAGYSLSNGPVFSKNPKHYPALKVDEMFVKAQKGLGGAKVVLFDTALESSVKRVNCSSESAFSDSMRSLLKEVLDTEPALSSGLNEMIDRRKQGMVNQAKADADDNGDDYEGVDFKPGKLDEGSVQPAALVCVGFKNEEGKYENREFLITLERKDDLSEKPKIVKISPEQAVDGFMGSAFSSSICKRIDAGEPIVVGVLPGVSMFTLKSFSDKFAQVTDEANPDNKAARYGDGPFMRGIAGGYSKAIVSFKGSFNSAYPSEDNLDGDASINRVVVHPRQMEMGMRKLPGGDGWDTPQPVNYDLPKYVCMAAKLQPEVEPPKPV